MTEFYVENIRMNKDIEKCVMPSCGKETPYSIQTPISQRLYYVEGAGQLCEPCYKMTYGGENGTR